MKVFSKFFIAVALLSLASSCGAENPEGGDGSVTQPEISAQSLTDNPWCLSVDGEFNQLRFHPDGTLEQERFEGLASDRRAYGSLAKRNGIWFLEEERLTLVLGGESYRYRRVVFEAGSAGIKSFAKFYDEIGLFDLYEYCEPPRP